MYSHLFFLEAIQASREIREHMHNETKRKVFFSLFHNNNFAALPDCMWYLSLSLCSFAECLIKIRLIFKVRETNSLPCESEWENAKRENEYSESEAKFLILNCQSSVAK